MVWLRVSWCLWVLIGCGVWFNWFCGVWVASWVLCSVGCCGCLVWCSFRDLGFNVSGGFLFDFVCVLVCGDSLLGVVDLCCCLV